ncbi:uncharacterized protein LOC141632870 [Silene latifolia]|uniref:uncharacterized protein LOC141632870 n=1 Tax=Silene latifolia TaxID=37657 RepID=UPI003D76B61B
MHSRSSSSDIVSKLCLLISSSSLTNTTTDTGYGSWMHVKKPVRKRNPRTDKAKNANEQGQKTPVVTILKNPTKGSGSRFEALEDEAGNGGDTDEPIDLNDRVPETQLHPDGNQDNDMLLNTNLNGSPKSLRNSPPRKEKSCSNQSQSFIGETPRENSQQNISVPISKENLSPNIPNLKAGSSISNWGEDSALNQITLGSSKLSSPRITPTKSNLSNTPKKSLSKISLNSSLNKEIKNKNKTLLSVKNSRPVYKKIVRPSSVSTLPCHGLKLLHQSDPHDPPPDRPPAHHLPLTSLLRDPTVLTAIPLAHQMELSIGSLLPSVSMIPESDLVVTITPWVMDTLNKLSKAFMSLVPSLPDLFMDRFPNFLSRRPALRRMTWNVQGAGSPAFMSMLQELIRVNSPQVLALVETHISGDVAQRVCDRINFGGKIRVEAQGFSGGIWLFWKPEEVTLTPVILHAQHIIVEISRVGEIPWYYSAVYASPDAAKKEELWRELESFASTHTRPWLAMGDYNDTRFLSERNGDSDCLRRRCLKFNAWVESNNRIELDYAGPDFTWSRGNSMATRQWARLDRAFCNSDWRVMFAEGSLRHLVQNQSDHCPIIVNTNGFAPIPKVLRPFRFQAAWMCHDKFSHFVKNNWDNNQPIFPFIHTFAENLQSWNKSVFHNIFAKKRSLEMRLLGVQRKLSRGGPYYLLKFELKLKRNLDEVLREEELLWFQKYRMEAICDGDRNTRFFHLSTVIRRKQNRIEGLQDSVGNWVWDAAVIQRMVLDYFQGLFAGPVTNICLTDLTLDESTKLGRNYLVADVQCALNQMSPYKAPGPDGFQALFYQSHWDIVSPSLCHMVLQMLHDNVFPDGLGEAFISLIPKVNNPHSVTQFRPIGLCNVSYKIITKMIVNRLKPVLSTLISPMQCSFVPKRQITDNIIIVQEILHSMRNKKGKKGFMALKLDLEKAYDKLEWPFIEHTLFDMRLPDKMIRAIMRCIRSTTLNVLWNGERTETFAPTRGIRQGDPLSPYIFTMCMEKLSQLIEQAVQAGEWTGFKCSRGGPNLTHLFFAYDIILFGEASIQQAKVINKCLNIFCQASGQRVSLAKSRVFFSPNIEDDVAAAIANKLHFDKTEDLGMYLGMPTINGRVTKETFDFIAQKVDKRLSGWKAKNLSLAGRTTLVQSTLSTIPSYPMQTAKLPRSLCDDLDRKTRRFLWGGDEDKRGISLMSWDVVTKEKSDGGLGLRSMRQVNTAFMAKLGWRMLSEPNSVWARVLRHKYCKGRCDAEMFQGKQVSSNVWKGIVEAVDVLKKGLRNSVGNGKSTLFWTVAWATARPLDTYSSMAIPTHLIGTSVEDMWDMESGWRWELFAEFLPNEVLHTIASYEVLPGLENDDQCYWSASTSGFFTIKSAIKIIRNEPRNEEASFWNLPWKTWAPRRMRVFLWLLLHDRIMSNANRARRGLTEDPCCGSCGDLEETSLHLLRDCSEARKVWSLFSVPKSQRFFEGFSVREWAIDNLSCGKTAEFESWPSMFAVIVWWIWKWRNCRVFGRSEDIAHNMFSFLMQKVWEVFNAKESLVAGKGETMRRKEIFVKWVAPPSNWLALNIDGASKGNPGPSGAGGIFRDSAGNIVEAFAECLGEATVTRAELIALRRGLLIALERKIPYLLIQTDSTTIMSFLESESSVPVAHSHMTNICKSLIMDSSWHADIFHIYREANACADWLANEGVKQSQQLVRYDLSNLPSQLYKLMQKDVGGVAWPRLVPSHLV